MTRSVARHLRINLRAPGINAAGQILQSLPPLAAQKRNGVCAADSVVAVDDDVFVTPIVQLADAQRKVAQRNQAGIGQCCPSVLPRLADIEQARGMRRLELLLKFVRGHVRESKP